jgi:hypothetical protein
MCDGLETFDRQHEIVGCFLSPALEGGWPLKSVKGRVDLERGELTRCKLEFFALYEPGWIEVAPPLRLLLAGCSHVSSRFVLPVLLVLRHRSQPSCGSRYPITINSTRQPL